MTNIESNLYQFKHEFRDELDRLGLKKKDVAKKLEMTMPTLNSKIENPITLTIKDIQNLKQLEFKLETLNI
jgi:hypothetical protein